MIVRLVIDAGNSDGCLSPGGGRLKHTANEGCVERRVRLAMIVVFCTLAASMTHTQVVGDYPALSTNISFNNGPNPSSLDLVIHGPLIGLTVRI